MAAPTAGVVCGTCGGPVYDRGSLQEDREPCPQCGSLSRRFMVTLEATLGPVADLVGGANEENLRLRAEIARLREEILRDELTKLWNRRGCNTALAEQLGGAPGEATAVFMLDIDHFKQVNDHHGGHAAGDAVLVEFANRLMSIIGAEGEIGRWSGDEFFVVLRGANEERACVVAETVCEVIRATEFSLPSGAGISITTTVGVACCPPYGPTADDVQRAADLQLMETKRADNRGTWSLARMMPTVTRASRRQPPPTRSRSRILP
jgi:diguanylate cyclase (GGDEF)-like protein